MESSEFLLYFEVALCRRILSRVSQRGYPKCPKFSGLQGSLISLIPTDVECALSCIAMAGQLSPSVSANPVECGHVGEIHPEMRAGVPTLICFSD